MEKVHGHQNNGIAAARGHENARLEYERELARANFVRAVRLGQQLGLDEQTIRQHQRAAIAQFLAEFQNYHGAAALIAEYGLTAQDVHALIEELLSRPELEARRVFSLSNGRLAHTSIAEQIQEFSERQTDVLKRRQGDPQSRRLPLCQLFPISIFRKWRDWGEFPPMKLREVTTGDRHPSFLLSQHIRKAARGGKAL